MPLKALIREVNVFFRFSYIFSYDDIIMLITHLGVLSAKDELCVWVDSTLTSQGQGAGVSRGATQRSLAGIADNRLLSLNQISMAS